MGGNASTMRNCTISVIHTNTGMRISVMPGARMLRMVVMKFTPASTEEAPRICRLEEPEVDAVSRRELPEREARVAEPAAVGRRADEEAGVQEQAAEQEDPVGQRVQPGEGHVARADHQRDHVVEEGGAERHDGQEHHRGAVHGEERVERLGAHHRAVRSRQLQADDQRLDPAEQEERERGDPVEDADPLVIDGGDPAEDGRERRRARRGPWRGRDRRRRAPLPATLGADPPSLLEARSGRRPAPWRRRRSGRGSACASRA